MFGDSVSDVEGGCIRRVHANVIPGARRRRRLRADVFCKMVVSLEFELAFFVGAQAFQQGSLCVSPS